MSNSPILVGFLASLALIASSAAAFAAPTDGFQVPEPASLLLFGTGVGAALLVKRWRDRR